MGPIRPLREGEWIQEWLIAEIAMAGNHALPDVQTEGVTRATPLEARTDSYGLLVIVMTEQLRQIADIGWTRIAWSLDWRLRSVTRTWSVCR